jgi:hypothetical protein
MAESQGMWVVKTLGLVVLAAVLTVLLSHYLQVLIWGKATPGVSGGAGAGVAVAVAVSRMRRRPGQATPPPA